MVSANSRSYLDEKSCYFESHLKFQITTSEISLTRKNKRSTWGLNISNIIAKLYDGLEIYSATVQSLDEKGIAKKCGLKERHQILEVNGESIRGWQSEDLKKVFESNTSVTVVVITVEDRSITDLFLMANREHDLRYLWALRKLVKLSICNIDLSEKGLDLSAITTTLYELIVTNCSLKCITQIQGVGRLKSLKRLILTHNSLETLDTRTMAKLPELTDLQLGYNKMKQFPIVLTNMDRLEELSLIHNQISSVPEDMVQMRSLEKLHLDNNVLTELPQYVTLQLPQLRALTLENNKFKDHQDSSYNTDTLASRRKFFYKIGVTDHSLAQN